MERTDKVGNTVVPEVLAEACGIAAAQRRKFGLFQVFSFTESCLNSKPAQPLGQVLFIWAYDEEDAKEQYRVAQADALKAHNSLIGPMRIRATLLA